MIVQDGSILQLDAQDTFSAACYWFLFTNNFTITRATVLSNLTEAAFSGYARVIVGSLNPAAIVGGRAQKTPVTFPQFTNADSVDHVIYGWGMANNGFTYLVGAVNIGAFTIPAGLTFALSVALSDTQE